MDNYLEIPVVRVHQKIGDFFLAKMTPKDLHTIANRNLSRLKDIEAGIQRDIQTQKVKEIKEYLALPDATLPNSIILAIQNNPADETNPSYVLEENTNTLRIKLEADTANILDGQHRLAGFDSEEKEFELPVSIFLDLSLGEQAKIFAKINSTQKKVSLDLVYDLFGITEERSAEKVAFYIVRHLNSEKDSAWYERIRTLSDRTGDLAQGSMAKFFHKELIEKNKIFKELYSQGRDTDMKNILFNYFNAVREVFPVAWENKEKKYILTKTTGFNGLMSFFITLIEIGAQKEVPLSKEFFRSYLIRSEGAFEEFTSDNFASGASGQKKIRDILRSTLSSDEREIAGI